MTNPRHDSLTQPLGRRERHKRATREALQEAAQELFADRGFAATTVRDIADAVGVTERTFFRYFAGKEELILDDVLDWLPLLQQAVVARPSDEPPVVAVLRATGALLRVPRTDGRPSPLLLFSAGRPVGRIGSSGPAFLMRVEDGLSAALSQRLGPDVVDAELRAGLAARVALAVFRTTLIESTRRGENPDEHRAELADRLDDATDMLRKDL